MKYLDNTIAYYCLGFLSRLCRETLQFINMGFLSSPILLWHFHFILRHDIPSEWDDFLLVNRNRQAIPSCQGDIDIYAHAIMIGHLLGSVMVMNAWITFILSQLCPAFVPVNANGENIQARWYIPARLDISARQDHVNMPYLVWVNLAIITEERQSKWLLQDWIE